MAALAAPRAFATPSRVASRSAAPSRRTRSTRARAKAENVSPDDPKFLGRKGTRRDEITDEDADTTVARVAVKLDGAFGKPSAAKETWEPFQRAARAGLMDAYVAGGASAAAGSKRGDASAEEEDAEDAEADVVHTSLCIAMEDDAFKSRTAVPLPIDAYVKRVDKLVNEFMQRDYESLVAAGTTTTRDVIDALEDYLYVQNQYRAPKGWREMYSPYRTYFHNVVAQKIGIPATLAAIYIGCVERLAERGVLTEGVDVCVRPKGARDSAAGVTAPSPPWGVIRESEERPSNAVVCTPLMSTRLQLSALKRAYWPWEWDDARDSGVLLAVEAAAYAAGNRMNTAAGVVGIIQPTGRPFGDLPMATLATERLLALDGGVGFEARDLGVLLFHDGRYGEALELLEGFEAWKRDGGADAAPIFVGDVVNLGGSDAVLAAELQVREDEALDRLMLILRKRVLEETIALDDDEKRSGTV